MKDNFSKQSVEYSKYRPLYPAALFEWLFSKVPVKKIAWDCATGNGQCASELSKAFDLVYASDISEKQLASAVKSANIIYKKEPAEKSSLDSGTVNLVTVAQAIHWFSFDEFYTEVKRVTAPNALIAVWAYSLLTINPEADRIIDEFHFDTLKEYWDEERKYVDNGYSGIPFPFREIECPEINMMVTWTIEQLEGYFNTWSAVQKFITSEKENPVPALMKEISKHLPAGKLIQIRFPLHLKMGHVH